MHLPRWHAVVNHESGMPHGNESLRIPEATKEAVDTVLEQLHERYAAADRSRGCSTAAGRRSCPTLTGGLFPATGRPRR